MRSVEEIRAEVEECTDVCDPRCQADDCNSARAPCAHPPPVGTYCHHDLEDAVRAGMLEALEPEPNCAFIHVVKGSPTGCRKGYVCGYHQAERRKQLEVRDD